MFFFLKIKCHIVSIILKASLIQETKIKNNIRREKNYNKISQDILIIKYTQSMTDS